MPFYNLVIAALRLLVVVGLNAVPIWGFTQDQWSPGTTLALYWVQGAIGIPVTAVLIVMHRHLTHKRGHYRAGSPRETPDGTRTTPGSFLGSFLLIAIPFALVHGVFLAFLLGGIWKNADGAVDYADLKLGVTILVNVMAIGFAVDTLQLARRPFAWIRDRSEALVQRSLVIQMVIMVGMGIAAISERDAATFFNVFLVLKLLTDLGNELPQWDPAEPPKLLRRFFGWLERVKPGGESFEDNWKRLRSEQKAKFEDDELEMPASSR